MDGLPRRLGRFDILGELARGGMAEILLARRVGPSGFERPVAIKRILPHYARQEAFVSMFLDEARIAASIRHPNVIHVEELERDDDGLYLVMEYLEGESVAGLLRRLFVLEQSIDPSVAAFIVAEACSGLHAAHEMADINGTKQNLVHRDVSPHNLFVTYDGQVKVLDFGIAKGADRISQTEAGQLKGKYEYMSPEQCSSKPLDRRSDIFSLGIVLYEVTTGRKLFKQENPVATIRAICGGVVVPPSRLVVDYPAALATVCMKALSTAPDDRYSTMAEMRRELLTLRVDDGAAEPRERLATLMRSIFADRAAEKADFLRRVRSGSMVTHVPVGEIDEGVELAPVPPELAAHHDASSKAGDTIASTTANTPKASRSVALMLAVGLCVILSVVTLTLALRPPRVSLVPGPSPSTPSATPIAAATAAAVPAESAPPRADILVPVEATPAKPRSIPHPQKPSAPSPWAKWH
jgi:eukaryotic-like serine/threonine-protein kinase